MKKQIITMALIMAQLLCSVPCTVFAEEQQTENDIKASVDTEDVVNGGTLYLHNSQNTANIWDNDKKFISADITNSLEYISSLGYKNDITDESINNVIYYAQNRELLNTDDFSRYLLIDGLKDKSYTHYLISTQNSDGGFGLTDNYSSDIIDTKLALKALEDRDETQAMSDAALYIASLQNEDGGFSYQSGLPSDAELTAEIADILADCIQKDKYLSYSLADAIKKLDTYLDSSNITLDNLSADNLSGVYQHFHTALFKLKTQGKYDTSSYTELQQQDGSVFDDPLSTSLFLELIVREQNTVTADLDYISVTDDTGKAVSAFSKDENVNIEVGNEYESSKAYLKVSIETPDSEVIDLDPENLKWNTGDSAEGTYKVTASIVRKSNDETLVQLEQNFRIDYILSVDSVEVSLSQGFARINDKLDVGVSAKLGIRNLDANSNASIVWSVKCGSDIISDNTKTLTPDDLASDTISLGNFTPDTTDKRVYLITVQVMSGDLIAAQSTTNFFVSDKSVAVLDDVDKEFLYEASDNAEISVKIRDERVVDLIFTTSSGNTPLIQEYADKIDKIKTRLEKSGYIVNVCTVSTSYLTAKDKFAWTEYDHENYKDTYVSDIPKHILYTDNSIQMLGYGWAPLKDFLLVPDDNKSQKILEFDLQRDHSNDWHTLDGGGFLFNTSIDSDNKLKGYCVLINNSGLNLIQLNGVDLNSFRNGSYNTVQNAGKLLFNYRLSDILAKHHLKLVADSETLSLWYGTTQVLDNYKLPVSDYGCGYGPITSYKSHGCSVRSSFEFSDITMRTIAGEKLSDILDHYNFESKDSRYVINLSDSSDECLDTDEKIKDIAQKIQDNNITFIGLGNDTNKQQFDALKESAPNTLYYDYSEKSDSMSDYIYDTEESKRVKVSDDIIATDLIFSGTLYDGSVFTKSFDSLCTGETLDIKIPSSPDNLTEGTDCVLLKNAQLTYKDENNVDRLRTADEITLPVIAPAGKVSNHVVTDKPEYSQYDDVVIYDRINDTSIIRSAPGLKNIITVYDTDNNVITQFTADLPEIMPGGYTERQEIMNTADCTPGNYKVISDIYHGETVVSSSEAEFTVNTPQLKLRGNITLSGKIFKSKDTISLESSVSNTGHVDLSNAKAVITVTDVRNSETVYQYEYPLELAASQSDTQNISFVPKTDFTKWIHDKYSVSLDVITEEGQNIPLAGDGFLLDGGFADILDDDILYSSDTDGLCKGISMNGYKYNINGSIHSNTDIQVSGSYLDISSASKSVMPSSFYTWKTNIAGGEKTVEISELPDVLQELKDRIINADKTENPDQWTETDSQVRLYSNSITLNSDVYSEKTLIIDPLSLYSDTEKGILICGEGDIIIRSSDVDFKGIIYAPNGTVKIESNNFNLRGRIIAKNIDYQGSCFTGEAYESDLELLN